MVLYAKPEAEASCRLENKQNVIQLAGAPLPVLTVRSGRCTPRLEWKEYVGLGKWVVGVERQAAVQHRASSTRRVGCKFVCCSSSRHNLLLRVLTIALLSLNLAPSFLTPARSSLFL